MSREPTQVAKSLIPLPKWSTDAYLNALDKAEELAGQPALAGEICAVLVEQGSIFAPVKKGQGVQIFLFNLMREDWVYTNAANDRYTTKSQEGYYNYTEWFTMKNKGYGLDSDQRVISLPETKTINMAQLFEILKSHDATKLEDNQWMFNGDYHFLD